MTEDQLEIERMLGEGCTNDPEPDSDNCQEELRKQLIEEILDSLIRSLDNR